MESSTVGIAEYQDLPKNARSYIELIEELSDISVDIVSTLDLQEIRSFKNQSIR